MDRQQQFMELIARHQSQVFGYIYALLRDLNETEDVYQQTCLVMWRKFDQLDPSVKFTTWACGIARLEVLTHLRQRGRRPLDFGEAFLEAAPADVYAVDSLGEDRRHALAECLKLLRADDRRLVEAIYTDDQTPQHAAGKAGRSVQAIYNSLSRIRRTLYDCINRRIAREQS